MGCVRVLGSEAPGGMKQTWERSCQSRREDRKCRSKGACERWEELNILWEYLTYSMQGELILLLSFCFLDLFIPWSGHALRPLPSSLLCRSSFLTCAARTCLTVPSVSGSLALQTCKCGKREAPHDWSGMYRKKKQKSCFTLGKQ